MEFASAVPETPIEVLFSNAPSAGVEITGASGGRLSKAPSVETKTMDCALESLRMAFVNPMDEVPTPMTLNSTVASFAVPLSAGAGARRVPYTDVIVPEVLLMTPALKKPLGELMSPGVTITASSTDALKLRSNWKPYKSVTSETTTSTVKVSLTAFAPTSGGSM